MRLKPIYHRRGSNSDFATKPLILKYNNMYILRTRDNPNYVWISVYILSRIFLLQPLKSYFKIMAACNESFVEPIFTFC